MATFVNPVPGAMKVLTRWLGSLRALIRRPKPNPKHSPPGGGEQKDIYPLW